MGNAFCCDSAASDDLTNTTQKGVTKKDAHTEGEKKCEGHDHAAGAKDGDKDNKAAATKGDEHDKDTGKKE